MRFSSIVVAACMRACVPESVLASRNGRRRASCEIHQKTPSLCVSVFHWVWSSPRSLELPAEIHVLQFDVTLDRFVREEENAVCEARTGNGNREAGIVGAEVANPGVLRERWRFGAGEAVFLVTRLCSVERHKLKCVRIWLPIEDGGRVDKPMLKILPRTSNQQQRL